MSTPILPCRASAVSTFAPRHRGHVGRRACGRGGFSLIELLIVIAVVALLLALAVPTLGRARQMARAMACAALVRQAAVGVAVYQSEQRCFPPHQIRFPDGSRRRWFATLAEYAGTRDVVRCPSVKDWEISRNHSLGYNYKYLGSLRVLDVAGPYRPWETFPVRDVRQPDRTIAFADCDGTGRSLPYSPEGVDEHPDRWGNHGYTLDPTYIPRRSLGVTSSGAAEPYSSKNFRSYMSVRHLGTANVAMVDASVRAMEPREAYRDNALWNGLGFDPGTDPTSSETRLDDHVAYRLDASSGQVWPFGE